MRILIVDDNMLFRMISSEVFSSFGNCETAKDGIEAMSMFENAIINNMGYDLVCLDVVLPIYSGFRILEEIRDYEKANKIERTKVVMMSGMDDSNTINKALNEGADYFFVKPLNKKEIEKFIKDNFNNE